MVGVGRQQCSRCRKTMDVSCFHLDVTKRSGHRSACKQCEDKGKKRSGKVPAEEVKPWIVDHWAGPEEHIRDAAQRLREAARVTQKLGYAPNGTYHMKELSRDA